MLYGQATSAESFKFSNARGTPPLLPNTLCLTLIRFDLNLTSYVHPYMYPAPLYIKHQGLFGVALLSRDMSYDHDQELP